MSNEHNEAKSPLGTPMPASGQPLRLVAPPGVAGATGARPKPPNKHDELRLLINSRHPIITVETPEEERLEALLMDVATELGVPLYEWSVTTGLAKARGASLYNTDSPEQGLANIALIQGDGKYKSWRSTAHGVAD